VFIRIAVYRARRKARILSKYSSLYIDGKVGGIPVGKFKDGKEVKI